MNIKTIIRLLFVVLAAGIIAVSDASAEGSTPYPLFVVAHDIEAREIEGVFRFCERKKLEKGVCYQTVNWFGKKHRMPQDWWSPETYIYAVTGRAATIVNLEPTQDGRGVVIYYQTESNEH